MSLFEFIVGMISVILALAIAQLFVGVADLMQARTRVRFFWPHGIWILNLFLITFVHWWSLWTFRDLDWNFGMFFYSLLGPSLMFFAASMISPRDRKTDVVDLADHFLSIRQLFLAVFLAMLTLFTFDGPLFGTEQAFNGLRMTQMFLGAMAVWGMVSASRRVHVAIALAVLAGVLAVVIIRFLPG